jgi:hypothetical protein
VEAPCGLKIQLKPAGQDPRRGKGGARPGAGRKSNQVKANEAVGFLYSAFNTTTSQGSLKAVISPEH